MLLRSKFFRPPVNDQLVLRNPLMELLDQSSNTALTTVVAPGGYGKSTLISQWLQGSRTNYCWLTLDQKDNDQTRFWHHLVGSIQNTLPDSCQEISAQLSQFGGAGITNYLDLLINDLHDLETKSLGIVLDDYQNIDNAEIHQGINYLLDYLPANVFFVIASRNEPPLNISQRLSKDQAQQITSTQLGFSETEAETFLSDTMQLELSQESKQQIISSTEGWVAGLKLAAITLKGSDNQQSYFSNFTGELKLIQDYLVTEVLNKQPKAIQDFLIMTSVLPRFNTLLCNQILKSDRGEHFLHELERLNLFLIPLDNNNQWFRYHDLFRDLLRGKFNHLAETRQKEIHRSAATWLQSNGYHLEALDHYVELKDWQKAADLLETFGDIHRYRAEVSILQEWLEILPDEVVQKRPKILILAVWTYTYLAKPNIATEYADQASRALSGDHIDAENLNSLNQLGIQTKEEYAQLLTDFHINRAVLARLQSDFTSSKYYSQLALDYSLKAHLTKKANCFFAVGQDLYLHGEIDQACDFLYQAIEYGMEEKELYCVIVSAGYLTLTVAQRGKSQPILTTLKKIESWAQEKNLIHLPLSKLLYVFFAAIYREQHELEVAQAQMNKGANYALNGATLVVRIAIRTFQVYLALSQKDFNLCRELLDELSELHTQSPNSLNFAWPKPPAFYALLSTLTQDKPGARAWLENVEQNLVNRTDYTLEKERIIYCKAKILIGEYQTALITLEDIRRVAEQQSRIGTQILCLLLEAVAKHSTNHKKEALTRLEQALTYAKNTELKQLLIDEVHLIKSLLLYALEQGIEKKYVSEILKNSGEATRPVEQLGVESLTKRESQILKLIEEGLSNRSIGDQLCISHSTVKTHTQNIFSKLGVSSRTQALIKARSLGLLESLAFST